MKLAKVMADKLTSFICKVIGSCCFQSRLFREINVIVGLDSVAELASTGQEYLTTYSINTNL